MANTRDPRLTLPSLRVLRAFLENSLQELAGTDIQKLTDLQTGTLYPILLRLEEAGWLVSSWEEIDPKVAQRPRRRYYRLTGLGTKKAQEAFAYTGVGREEPAWAF